MNDLTIHKKEVLSAAVRFVDITESISSSKNTSTLDIIKYKKCLFDLKESVKKLNFEEESQ